MTPVVDASPRVQDLALHDHVCWVYSTDAEYRTVLTSYLSDGLRRGERVMYLRAPDEDGELIAEYLTTAGIPVAGKVASGQLVLAAAESEYLVGGQLDPDERLRGYGAAVSTAIDDGFHGLRVAADVSWLLDLPEIRAAWTSYEFRADLLAADLPITGLCAYGGRRCRPGDLALVESLHRCVMRGGPAGPDSGFRLHGQLDGSVRLRGELDLRYAGQVGELLSGAATSRAAVLDLTDLEFVDMAAMRGIALACEAMIDAHGGATIRGASPMFRRVWHMGAFDRAVPAIVME